ncbi:MAG TPA: FAD-binding protein [Gammaproteobacteria bacterium]|nr:FAD-binding protein [Gammaproteobacteria bacterium]
MSATEEGALRPRDAQDAAEIVARHPRALEVVGGGSKRAIGRPVDGDVLDLRALTGIVTYEPAELVLTARAATPLAKVERALAAAGQRLAFEPPRLATLLGEPAEPTLGGVLAANLAGSRRVSAGAARDHFLGCTAVTGRGELVRAGGKVVKNVTGYDVPKVLAGSWGTLAVLTEVTVRVAPAPETETTLCVPSRTPEEAVPVLSAALGSAHDVSAAAFDPARGALLRIEGFAASVAARASALRELLAPAEVESVDPQASAALWRELGSAAALASYPVVWRVSVPPSHAPRAVAALAPERYLLDWGGGLILAAYRDVDAARVRGAVPAGHATLLKAPASARRAV